MSNLKLNYFNTHYSELSAEELAEPRIVEHWIALGLTQDTKHRQWHSLIAEGTKKTIRELNAWNESHWNMYPDEGNIVKLPLLLLGEKCECIRDISNLIIQLTCEEHAIIDYDINSQNVNDWIHTVWDKRDIHNTFYRLNNGNILKSL